MPTLIQMPKLGLTMTEGTIAEWVAAEGQQVSAGEVVMLIETDKVEAEVEAVADGVVHHTAAVGETLEPGEGVGWLLGDGEAPPDGPAPAAPADEPAVAAAAPEPAAEAAAPAPAPAGGRVVASPNARRVAAEMGIDLATVTGTGPDGRITSEDVEAAVPPGRGIGGRILASPNARRVAAERWGRSRHGHRNRPRRPHHLRGRPGRRRQHARRARTESGSRCCRRAGPEHGRLGPLRPLCSQEGRRTPRRRHRRRGRDRPRRARVPQGRLRPRTQPWRLAAPAGGRGSGGTTGRRCRADEGACEASSPTACTRRCRRWRS